MTKERIAEMLRASGKMTEHDIERHIKDGVLVYENYEDFKDDCLAGMVDEDEIPEMWAKLDIYDFDGKTYHVDFCI